jgi:hypothetical protein
VADGDGPTHQDRRGWVIEQPFIADQAKQPLFERPQIGRLSHKGCAMELAQGREKVHSMPTKLAVKRFVLVDQEGGSNHFHRDHLALSKLRHRSLASQSLSFQDRWQWVINQTQTCDNEIVQAHGGPPKSLRCCLTKESRPHELFLLQDQLVHRVQ